MLKRQLRPSHRVDRGPIARANESAFLHLVGAQEKAAMECEGKERAHHRLEHVVVDR